VESPVAGIKQRILELNRTAERFFRAALGDPARGRRARAYLEQRGIGEPTAVRLGLGYAPEGWETLRNFLLAQRYRSDELVTAGVTVQRREGTGEYDRFRDRLMFPIRDAGGRTVAFGGRALGSDEPKYLNSPETPAYTKGDHLYGLDLAREAIRHKGYAIVVEGYLDLAALHQAGFENVVASLGTAFTPAQARALLRFTQTVVVSYDGDSAGTSATIRSLDLLIEKGLEVRAAELPAGQDPDDFIRAHDASAYQRLLDTAPGYFDYLIRREISRRDLSRIEDRIAAANALLPRLAKVPRSIERMAWADHLAETLRISDAAVRQELRSALRAGRPTIRQRAEADAPIREVEARLVTAMIRVPDGPAAVRASLDPTDLVGLRVATIVDTICRLFDEGIRTDYPTVHGAIPNEEDRQLFSRIAFRDEPEVEAGEIEHCARVIRRERLIKEGHEVQQAIQNAVDPAVVDALLQRKLQLGRQIDALS
jgi:DNA primase